MNEQISDLDVHRLKKERPDLEVDLIKFFGAAISQFIKTPQYEVLKNLRLSFFFDEEALDSAGFADATFEELVSIGVYDVCSLPAVSIELVEGFVRVLEKLVDGSDGVAEEIASTMFLSPPELEPVQTRGFEDLPYAPLSDQNGAERGTKELVLAGPVLNSIEAEVKLLAAFRKVREHPHMQQFFQKPLADYWKAEWVRAPFVEMLTFKQLIDMKLSNLLDKRTFSHHKIHAILQCIDTVCEEFAAGEASPQTAATVPILPVEAKPALPTRAMQWKKQEADLPMLVSAVASYFLSKSAALEIPEDISTAFFNALSNGEGGVLLLEAELGTPYLAELLDWTENALESKVVLAQRKLQKSLEKEAKDSILQIERLLQSPAVLVSVLMGGEFTESEQGRLSEVFATAILQSLGAEIAEIEEVPLEKCWTTNQKGLKIVWNAIAASSPKTKKAFLQIALPMLPFVPEEVLAALWGSSSIRPSKTKG